MSVIGEQIKKYRGIRGMTQQEIADALGESSGRVIYNWEKGIGRPDCDKLAKLCDLLDVSADEMIGCRSMSERPTAAEWETIKKYRVLDEHGKEIAIITSPTAAGYEDFMNQLTRNKGGYPFYTKLFPALMQGERTEASVIAALDRIYQHQDLFDVVVIIRGGGATSDLNSFDSYLLAANCAQFPLPIITGIGHERDDTVVDLVAHTRMKTPTAVAEFLISRMDSVGEELESLRQDVSLLAMDILSRQKNYLQLVATRFPSIVTSRIERNRSGLQTIASRLPAMASGLLSRRQSVLENTELRLRNGITSKLSEDVRFIQLTEQFIKMASPDYILKRGYSLALKDGKIIKHASDLRAGEELTTRFIDGEIKSIIKP